MLAPHVAPPNDLNPEKRSPASALQAATLPQPSPPTMGPMFLSQSPQVNAAESPKMDRPYGIPMQQTMHQPMHQPMQQPIYVSYGGLQPYPPAPPMYNSPNSGTSPINVPQAPFPVPVSLASSAPSTFPSAMHYAQTAASYDKAPMHSEPAAGSAFVQFNPKTRNLPLGRRMKVSRACDECRRKKTRCDYDATREVCSPCRRACVPCTFERVQLKRGPARKRYSQAVSQSPDLMSVESPKQLRPRSMSTSSTLSNSESLLPSIEHLMRPNEDVKPKKLSHSPSHSHSHSHPHSSSHPNQHSPTQGESKPHPSSLPLLVEIACRQSESPSEDTGPITPLSTTDKSDQVTLDKQKDVSATTPPPQYDTGLHGISHGALMSYYTFVHPTFPLLPDLVADLDEMLSAAGPAKEYLVAALNELDEKMEHSAGVVVPLGIGSMSPPGHRNSTVREVHFIALMLMFMRTMDAAWLGAGGAMCAELLNDAHCTRAKQLVAVLVACDCIRSTLFDFPSLLPKYFTDAALQCQRTYPLLSLLQCGTTSDDQHRHFFTAPEAMLRTVGQLHQNQVTREDARSKLQTLRPQLQHTPLEIFVRHIS